MRNFKLMIVSMLGVALVSGGAVYGMMKKFSDVEAGKYYEAPVNKFSELGILNGYANGEFGPNDPLTRGQVATILDRYDNYLEKKFVMKEKVGVKPEFISAQKVGEVVKGSNIMKKIVGDDKDFWSEEAILEVPRKAEAFDRNTAMIAFNPTVDVLYEKNKGKLVFIANVRCLSPEVCERMFKDHVEVPTELTTDATLGDRPVDTAKLSFVVDAKTGELIMFEYGTAFPIGDAEAYNEHFQIVK